jgi:thioredoxin-like negative regulator of GroEL
LFEWDDAAAAHEHRLDRAREIIRVVLVSITTTQRTVEVVRYVRDPDAGRKQGYLSLIQARDEGQDIRVAIAECNRALSLVERARDIVAALGLGEDGEQAVGALITWRDALLDQGQSQPQAMAAD